MTEEKLEELNGVSNDIKVLKHMLDNIQMLRELNVHCAGGVQIIGENFYNSSVILNLCDKLKPAVEEELERLEKKFTSD